MSSSPEPGKAAEAGEWGTLLPCVVEFLSLQAWPDATPRMTGTVMLFFEAGQWKLWANDRGAAEGMFVSGSSPEACLLALEACLESGTGDWRASKRGSKR